MMNKDSKISKKRISILGCGWLGLPLAKRLIEHDISSAVKGSTTSTYKLDTLHAANIEGYLLDLNPEFNAYETKVNAFFETDLLVISLPPRMSQNAPGYYVRQVEAIIAKIKTSEIREIIFLSSTGIYPDLNKVMIESDVAGPEESAHTEMVKAENLIASLRPDRTVCILRLAGLIGNDRIPGKYVKGKKELSTGSLPVNYIHPHDAVGMMATMIQEGLYNETFNIVAPQHPTRREVYDSNCAEFGWEPPTYTISDNAPDYKIISGEKFSEYYRYHFQYPDPLQFEFHINS